MYIEEWGMKAALPLSYPTLNHKLLIVILSEVKNLNKISVLEVYRTKVLWNIESSFTFSIFTKNRKFAISKQTFS